MNTCNLSDSNSRVSKRGNRRILFYLLFITVFEFSASAQEVHDTYKTALGVRGGYYPGITVKQFIIGNAALEGILHAHTRYRGFLFTGLYEIHSQAFGVPRLYWFYGLGGHAGFYDSRYLGDRNGGVDRKVTVLGIDGILGMEYHITEIPFTVGLDIKPFFEILNFGYGNLDGALTLRYTF